MDFYDDIDDEEYDTVYEFDDYIGSLTEEQFAGELAFIDAVASAIQQGKNVVPNNARHYDFMM